MKRKILPASVSIVSLEFITDDDNWHREQELCNREIFVEWSPVCVWWFRIAIEFKLAERLLLDGK